jgi:hypothetical protein
LGHLFTDVGNTGALLEKYVASCIHEI